MNFVDTTLARLATLKGEVDDELRLVNRILSQGGLQRLAGGRSEPDSLINLDLSVKALEDAERRYSDLADLYADLLLRIRDAMFVGIRHEHRRFPSIGALPTQLYITRTEQIFSGQGDFKFYVTIQRLKFTWIPNDPDAFDVEVNAKYYLEPGFDGADVFQESQWALNTHEMVWMVSGEVAEGRIRMWRIPKDLPEQEEAPPIAELLDIEMETIELVDRMNLFDPETSDDPPVALYESYIQNDWSDVAPFIPGEEHVPSYASYTRYEFQSGATAGLYRRYSAPFTLVILDPPNPPQLIPVPSQLDYEVEFETSPEPSGSASPTSGAVDKINYLYLNSSGDPVFDGTYHTEGGDAGGRYTGWQFNVFSRDPHNEQDHFETLSIQSEGDGEFSYSWTLINAAFECTYSYNSQSGGPSDSGNCSFTPDLKANLTRAANLLIGFGTTKQDPPTQFFNQDDLPAQELRPNSGLWTHLSHFYQVRRDDECDTYCSISPNATFWGDAVPSDFFDFYEFPPTSLLPFGPRLIGASLGDEIVISTSRKESCSPEGGTGVFDGSSGAGTALQPDVTGQALSVSDILPSLAMVLTVDTEGVGQGIGPAYLPTPGDGTVTWRSGTPPEIIALGCPARDTKANLDAQEEALEEDFTTETTQELKRNALGSRLLEEVLVAPGFLTFTASMDEAASALMTAVQMQNNDYRVIRDRGGRFSHEAMLDQNGDLITQSNSLAFPEKIFVGSAKGLFFQRRFIGLNYQAYLGFVLNGSTDAGPLQTDGDLDNMILLGSATGISDIIDI
jgi:hypothetical protein